MGLNIKIVVEEVDVDTDALAKAVESDPRFVGLNVVVDAPHAEYIEFGTDGNPNWGDNPKRSKKGKGTFLKSPPQVYTNLKKWVMERGGIPEADADAITYPIYRKIMKEGIPPQPFIRPAIYNVKQRLDEGGDLHMAELSLEDIAKMLIAEMWRLLDENRTLYGGNALLNSIYIESFESTSLDFDMSQDIPQEIWENPYADKHGDTTRALKRKSNIDRLRW